MALQIFSEGASIRFMGFGGEKLVQKNKIVNITVIGDQIIRMDLAEPIHTFLIRHENVTLPSTVNASSLAIAINLMISDCVCSKVCDCGEEHQ